MVIAVGSFEVDTSNWTPFAPNDLTAVITGATVVFFAYVGFDAVANSAEESKNPQVMLGHNCNVQYCLKISNGCNECLYFGSILETLKSPVAYFREVYFSEILYLCLQRDLPLGILVSLFICAGLYVAVCLVVTGMVPYANLGGDAPLANAFREKGLKFVSILISVGAVCGLTTTVLVGLYVQVLILCT